MRSSENIALYVHWPFCKAKCPYCDFNSHVREGVNQARWKTALVKELNFMAERLPSRRLTSIFFGGGTPSLMPADTVAAVIDAATSRWQADDHLEITLEANPTSVEAEKFAGFRLAGVNRVSLGIQSLNAADLKFLGRQHSVQEALAALELAAAHFPRWSFDLIYARPGQTLTSWEAELTRALSFGARHMSLYQLTIEENTAFHHAYHREHAFALPEEDVSADLYTLTQQIMESRGMPAYEVSNHAAAGEESRHNLSYWLSEEYAGIGPGAHGRVKSELQVVSCKLQKEITYNLQLATHFATQTLKSPERWLEAVERQGHGVEIWEPIAPEIRREEKWMMRLRLSRPIPAAEWQGDLSEENVMRLARQGMVALDASQALSLTREGKLLLTTVTAKLLAS